MAATLAAMGEPGDDQSWQFFDKVFSDALARLFSSKCDLAAIASVTPHARFSSVAKGAPIPIVRIVDAVEAELKASKPEVMLVLGTSVTTPGTVFDAVLEHCGCSKIGTTASQVGAFTELLETFFCRRRSAEGRKELLEYVWPLIDNPVSPLIFLACTDIAPAFPEINETVMFDADGFRFLDSTSAHVTAILQAVRM